MDYIFRSKKFKRLSPKEQKEARKQANEYLRIHRSALTSQERLELEKQAKASSSFDTWREDAHRRAGVPAPFPLEEIYYYTTDGTVPADGVYDHDDPEYLERTSIAAYGAINDYLMFFYKPELYLNKEQLKIATDVALDIRAVYHDLRNIPLAENPDNPNEQDFIRLGQWFLDAHTAITKQITSGGGKAGNKKQQEHKKTLEGEWSNPMTKSAMMSRVNIDGYKKFNTFAKQFGLRKAGNRQLWQIRLDKMDKNTRQKFEKA